MWNTSSRCRVTCRISPAQPPSHIKCPPDRVVTKLVILVGEVIPRLVDHPAWGPHEAFADSKRSAEDYQFLWLQHPDHAYFMWCLTVAFKPKEDTDGQIRLFGPPAHVKLSSEGEQQQVRAYAKELQAGGTSPSFLYTHTRHYIYFCYIIHGGLDPMQRPRQFVKLSDCLLNHDKPAVNAEAFSFTLNSHQTDTKQPVGESSSTPALPTTPPYHECVEDNQASASRSLDDPTSQSQPLDQLPKPDQRSRFFSNLQCRSEMEWFRKNSSYVYERAYPRPNALPQRSNPEKAPSNLCHTLAEPSLLTAALEAFTLKTKDSSTQEKDGTNQQSKPDLLAGSDPNASRAANCASPPSDPPSNNSSQVAINVDDFDDINLLDDSEYETIEYSDVDDALA